MNSLRTIYFHGALRSFGKSFRLSVKSPAEAVKALACQLPGFAAAIRDGYYRVVTGERARRRDRAEDELAAGFSGALHIIPVISGAGGGRGLGIGLAIAGAALLGLAFGAPLVLGASFASTTILGVSSSTVALFGASLALTGLSSLLAPKPKLEGGTVSPDSSQMESFLFGGAPERAVTGRPIPLVFGRFRVVCLPISVQIKNVRQVVGVSADGHSYRS